MRKLNLIKISELEKMNSSELQCIKGGISANNSLMASVTAEMADSHDHDCKKKDHFEESTIMF